MELSFRFDQRRLARLGIIGLALLLTFSSLFLGWWTRHSEGKAGENRFEDVSRAYPFDAGRFSDANAFEGEGLDDEVRVTGWLMIVSTLSVLAVLALELAAAMGFRASPAQQAVPAALAVLPSLAAVVFTALAWPAGWAAGTTFFDSENVRNTVGLQADIAFYAGMGWYFAILGGAAIPTALFLYTHVFNADPGMEDVLREAGVKAVPSTQVAVATPPPPYTPPPSNVPTYAPARAPIVDTVGPSRRAPIAKSKE